MMFRTGFKFPFYKSCVFGHVAGGHVQMLFRNLLAAMAMFGAAVAGNLHKLTTCYYSYEDASCDTPKPDLCDQFMPLLYVCVRPDKTHTRGLI